VVSFTLTLRVGVMRLRYRLFDGRRRGRPARPVQALREIVRRRPRLRGPDRSVLGLGTNAASLAIKTARPDPMAEGRPHATRILAILPS